MANNCSISLQGAPSNMVLQKVRSSSSLHVHGLDPICLLLYFQSTLPTNLLFVLQTIKNHREARFVGELGVPLLHQR